MWFSPPATKAHAVGTDVPIGNLADDGAERRIK
jgi:hypothetical protein